MFFNRQISLATITNYNYLTEVITDSKSKLHFSSYDMSHELIKASIRKKTLSTHQPINSTTLLLPPTGSTTHSNILYCNSTWYNCGPLNRKVLTFSPPRKPTDDAFHTTCTRMCSTYSQLRTHVNNARAEEQTHWAIYICVSNSISMAKPAAKPRSNAEVRRCRRLCKVFLRGVLAMRRELATLFSFVIASVCHHH